MFESVTEDARICLRINASQLKLHAAHSFTQPLIILWVPHFFMRSSVLAQQTKKQVDIFNILVDVEPVGYRELPHSFSGLPTKPWRPDHHDTPTLRSSQTLSCLIANLLASTAMPRSNLTVADSASNWHYRKPDALSNCQASVDATAYISYCAFQD